MAVSELFFWNKLPPVVRRVYRGCFVLSIVAIVVAVGTLVFRDSLDWLGQPWRKLVPVAFSVLPAGVIYPIGTWLVRGIRRDWHASGGRLCTYCGYDLSTIAPVGLCPECGKRYDINADATTWKLAGFERKPGADAPTIGIEESGRSPDSIR